MATRQRKLVESLGEFISRLWPVSKTEEKILKEQRAMYRSKTGGGESSIATEADSGN